VKIEEHEAFSIDDEGGGHLDIISELGCELKQPIPKGDAFIEWIADEATQRRCVAALLKRGFLWDEIRVGLFDLSRMRWDPAIEQLQQTQEVEPTSAPRGRKLARIEFD
jgi:hypothetical protein